MKIHVPGPNSFTRTFLQVIQFDEKHTEVEQASEADIVLTTTIDELRGLYTEDKFFGLLPARLSERQKEQPSNVFVIDALNLFENISGVAGFKAAFEKWAGDRKTAKPRERLVVPKDIVKFERGHSVLIVDDNPENLSYAMMVLPGQQMAPFTRVEDALRLLSLPGKTFNAVLTDMHMKPDKHYGSLNLDHYGLTETVPYGFAVVLEATKRGIPVAVVTDANHHADLFSAMFDKITEANVNGQRVIFCNNIGKRWDIALKRLLYPKQSSD